jgi:hypothetical protein
MVELAGRDTILMVTSPEVTGRTFSGLNNTGLRWMLIASCTQHLTSKVKSY